MFPVLSFGVHSLNFTDLYTMEVEVLNSDNNRYKYVSVTGWRVNGVASQEEGNKRMFHPEGIIHPYTLYHHAIYYFKNFKNFPFSRPLVNKLENCCKNIRDTRPAPRYIQKNIINK